MTIKFSLGLNLVSPPHELLAEGEFVQCSELLNFICRDRKITKVGGTEEYNSSALTNGIPWVVRSYHKRGDGTFRKVVFCFTGGSIYYGDEVDGSLTEAQAGFIPTAKPSHATMQVSGNSILYFFPGTRMEDEVYKYDGNAGFDFEKVKLNEALGRVIESAVVHLDRMWYISKNSSTLAYATTLKPEDLTTDSADITIGQETDSLIRRAVLGAGEVFYVFKNQSIWQLFGRTPSTFQFRKVTGKYGLASRNGIYPVGSGFVFLNEFDKELYFFGGTETSIHPLTERDIKLREILDPTQIDNVAMTVHDGLFRFSFKHKDDNIYANRELIYAVNEPGINGLPKWSETKGAKILSYSVWNQQGDRNELVSGRSDTGKLMYHNRTHDYDGTAMETRVRTREIVASEDKVVRFKGFMVKGKPGSVQRKVKFRYFLDGRYSDSTEDELDVSGERRTIGAMKLSTQILFNNRLKPYHNYSLGNSISFQLEDLNAGTFIELYSVQVKVRERGKKRNSLVGV